MGDAARHRALIKAKARELGFLDCGIAEAGFLKEEARGLEQYLAEERHGDMHYMEGHFDKRSDPTRLVDRARSVISVILNYYPRRRQRGDTYQISKYAYGRDYHLVMKKMLGQLLAYINQEVAPVNGRAFVDTAPVMDKVWAQKAGLGWIGKNTNLISPRHGSFIFIGELIVDLELPPDTPMRDYCGNCRKCLDACPTGALTDAWRIDATRCISYLTIENKGDIPEDLAGQYQDWIFGCDVCQDVCPWNRKSRPTSVEAFEPHPDLLNLTRPDWERLSRAHFRELFKKSAVKRTKYEGLMRNIHAAGSSDPEEDPA